MVDHIIRNKYIYSFYIVGANKQWWDGLSVDVKEGLNEALAAATKWNWDNEAKVNQEAVDFIRSKNIKVHELTAEQSKAWQDAVDPVWTELGEKVAGADVMARLKEIAAKYPPK